MTSEMELTCTTCRFSGPCEAFKKCARNKCGYAPTCRTCANENGKVYYAANKEAIRQRERMHRAARTEEQKQQYRHSRRKYYNRAYQSEYGRANRERLNKYRAKFYKENRERLLAKSKAWQKANPEKVREIKRRFAESHPNYNRDYHRGYDKVYHPLSIDSFQVVAAPGLTPVEAIADTKAVDPYRALDVEALFDWVKSLPHDQSTVVWHYMEALESVPREEAAAETARVMALTEARVNEIMEQVRIRAKWQIPL